MSCVSLILHFEKLSALLTCSQDYLSHSTSRTNTPLDTHQRPPQPFCTPLECAARVRGRPPPGICPTTDHCTVSQTQHTDCKANLTDTIHHHQPMVNRTAPITSAESHGSSHQPHVPLRGSCSHDQASPRVPVTKTSSGHILTATPTRAVAIAGASLGWCILSLLQLSRSDCGLRTPRIWFQAYPARTLTTATCRPPYAAAPLASATISSWMLGGTCA